MVQDSITGSFTEYQVIGSRGFWGLALLNLFRLLNITCRYTSQLLVQGVSHFSIATLASVKC